MSVPWYRDPAYLSYCKLPPCDSGPSGQCREEKYDSQCLQLLVADVISKTEELEQKLEDLDQNSAPIPEGGTEEVPNLWGISSDTSATSNNDSGKVYIANSCAKSERNLCARQMFEKHGVRDVPTFKLACVQKRGVFSEDGNTYGKTGFCSVSITSDTNCNEFDQTERAYLLRCMNIK